MTDPNAAASNSTAATVDGNERHEAPTQVAQATTGGLPYYEKSRQQLKELLAKKRALDRRLQAQEELIYQKETEYLESTPAGNIITGFDNYTKGTPNNAAAAAAARRKGGGGGGGGGAALDQLIEKNRVFSRSSISYNGKGADGSDGAQTPGGASTPADEAQTPGSGKNVGGGGGAKKVVVKKRDAAGDGDGDDGPGNGRDAKKVRVNFGGGGGQLNGGARK
ncbi:chromatin modification-related protein [Cladorrhinum sp. PSN259]|nr:chromatin modification-related protein [Cladorrhinum sp. PSN259]